MVYVTDHRLRMLACMSTLSHRQTSCTAVHMVRAHGAHKEIVQGGDLIGYNLQLRFRNDLGRCHY